MVGDLEKFTEMAEWAEYGRQVVASGWLLELRAKLGFSRKMMSELLHTSPLTYRQWETNTKVKLWPATAQRIGRFYSQATQVLREMEAEDVVLSRYLPFYMAAAHMAIPQELLLSRYRAGQFEALDLGILGLWMPREYLNLEQDEDIRGGVDGRLRDHAKAWPDLHKEAGVHTPEFLKPTEVAAALGVQAQTVVMWCRKGRMTYIRPAHGTIRIPASELERILRLSEDREKGGVR